VRGVKKEYGKPGDPKLALQNGEQRGLIALAAIALFVGPVLAQTRTTIERADLDPSQIRLLVSHPVAGSTNFAAQASGNFTQWDTIPGATFTQVDSGHFELGIPRSAEPYRFFRVLATLSDNDGDGDGLPTEVEQGLGTDPLKVDSDGDGVSDGLEVLAGTDPSSSNSVPGQTDVPVAVFTNAVSAAEEGENARVLNVVFDRPFTGMLHYEINARSTATAPNDFETLAGTVAVAGAGAQIVVTPVDDLVVSGERLLLLDLVQAAGYRLGVQSSHTVRLVDNDAYWNGSLKDRYALRNFRLRLCRSNEVTEACFVAGQGFDGLPVLDTSAPGTSVSEGIIPAGCADASVHADTNTLFSISSPELAAGNAGIFAGSVDLVRTLDLVAAATNTGHTIEDALIVGSYAERIGVTNTASSYLDRTHAGSFVLVRDLPARPVVANGVTLP
jgi:hypothetical protein